MGNNDADFEDFIFDVIFTNHKIDKYLLTDYLSKNLYLNNHYKYNFLINYIINNSIKIDSNILLVSFFFNDYDILFPNNITQKFKLIELFKNKNIINIDDITLFRNKNQIKELILITIEFFYINTNNNNNIKIDLLDHLINCGINTYKFKYFIDEMFELYDELDLTCDKKKLLKLLETIIKYDVDIYDNIYNICKESKKSMCKNIMSRIIINENNPNIKTYIIKNINGVLEAHESNFNNIKKNDMILMIDENDVKNLDIIDNDVKSNINGVLEAHESNINNIKKNDIILMVDENDVKNLDIIDNNVKSNINGIIIMVMILIIVIIIKFRKL